MRLTCATIFLLSLSSGASADARSALDVRCDLFAEYAEMAVEFHQLGQSLSETLAQIRNMRPEGGEVVDILREIAIQAYERPIFVFEDSNEAVRREFRTRIHTRCLRDPSMRQLLGESAAPTGNIAASNYPDLVMRRLSQAERPQLNASGTAVVAFNISADGSLASVSLARSSGSSALDEAAEQLVRDAGPFPPPPHGAQRSFSIQIKGRDAGTTQ